MYVPERIMENHELSGLVDTSDEWIYSHTGIRRRRIAADHQATSDLAVLAGEQALIRAGLPAENLDLVLVATSTPDYLGFPSTASLVQHGLGASKAGAFDISAACTGFVYALETARAFIVAGTARHVLVIGAETFSRIVNWKDRNTCILFGDGAGAVLLGHSDDAGFYPSYLRSEGEGGSSLLRPTGGTRVPKSTGPDSSFVAMDGRAVYAFAIRVIKDSILEVLARNGRRLDEVKWIVPHQANVRIVDSAAKRLELPLDRFYLNMEDYANTSGATIPLALAEMDAKGLLSRGDLVLTVGFGAGLSYGANLFTW
jgi:3-oxoacyl-[acyl-carrier-protein] synthase-3